MEIALDKSFKERIFHAVVFEVTANVIIALSFSGKPIAHDPKRALRYQKQSSLPESHQAEQ